MKVLIPIDGSGCSDETLKWAVNTLDRQNTAFYLLYVAPSQDGSALEPEEEQSAGRLLEKARQQVVGYGGNVIQAEFIVGDPAEAICNYAEAQGVDQVVMGSHGKTGLAKLLLGSVSASVLQHCRKPVFIYRSRAHREASVGPNTML